MINRSGSKITCKIKDFVTDRHGSSAVFLAIAFLAFAICITGAIGISRKLTVMSTCEAYGRVWTRAILSEYDLHLLEDYRLMAYWGNEIEVNRKIDDYLDYSLADRLDVRLGLTSSDLSGYELGYPDNFRAAMDKGFAMYAADALIHSTGRKKRYEEDEEDKSIGNTVVLDTLPSGGAGGSFSTDSLVERAKSAGDEKGVRSAASSAGLEIAFIWQYFNSCVTLSDDKPHYLRNELEYVIKGSPDDETNYTACRKRLFLARNALNLAALYKDPAKVELVASVAQLITPGPLGAATQVLLSEAWAAAETEKDLEVLYDNGRVPVLKTGEQWMTDLESVLGSSEVRKKLDDESRQLLDESGEDLHSIPGINNAAEIVTEGLSYDEYLILMILCLNRTTRTLRIMDIVQIDMKYRYYRDFNLMEYYTGVRYALTADGNSYEFEDSYR